MFLVFKKRGGFGVAWQIFRGAEAPLSHPLAPPLEEGGSGRALISHKSADTLRDDGTCGGEAERLVDKVFLAVQVEVQRLQLLQVERRLVVLGERASPDLRHLSLDRRQALQPIAIRQRFLDYRTKKI